MDARKQQHFGSRRFVARVFGLSPAQLDHLVSQLGIDPAMEIDDVVYFDNDQQLGIMAACKLHRLGQWRDKEGGQ